VINSSEGTNWSSQELPNIYALVGITYGDHHFVTVGARGAILSSTDGVTWIQRLTGMDSVGFTGVCHGRGTFVVVGAGGTILQSEFSGPPLLDINRSGSSMELSVTAELSGGYRLQTSGNLRDWTDLFTCIGPTNVTMSLEGNSAGPAQSFYRAVVD
jgi:hypothetical protein